MLHQIVLTPALVTYCKISNWISVRDITDSQIKISVLMHTHTHTHTHTRTGTIIKGTTPTTAIFTLPLCYKESKLTRIRKANGLGWYTYNIATRANYTYTNFEVEERLERLGKKQA